MAASESNRVVDVGEAASTEKQGPDVGFWAGLGPIVKREPVVKLLSPVSGLEALTWSEDHRLAVSTVNSVSIMELVCDQHTHSQGLVLHRTHIPVPESVCELKVGPEDKVQSAKQNFENSDDPSVRQVFLLDRIMNPQGGALRGMKYTSWSPLGCDVNGRCILACLTLDCRLTIHSGHKRLQWTQLLNLTELYGDMLKSRNYSNANASEPSLEDLEDLEVLQSRYQMQTPVRMEWSSLCNTHQIQSNNECKDVGTVLLAVLMENGDLVVWQFRLPVQGKESVVSCNTIKSGVSSPSVLAWWEYEHGGRKMSGLIVGSTVGPVKILPVNLKAVKGYFTLRQPVVLWQDSDNIPVNDVKCIALFHPQQKCNCSLVVAARGPYVFWCLLLISKAGLNVHNSHVTGLHSAPITSLSATHSGSSVFTCSLDGTVKKLMPVFTDSAILFKQQEVELPEGVRGCRIHGIATSPNGAYLALATTEGMINGLHPVVCTNLVQFITLMTPDKAGAELLESQTQSLYKQTDLLDLVRWRVMHDKQIPQFLQDELDEKTPTSNSTYLWRLKLFLLRVLHQSLQKVPVEARWRPTHEDSKAFLPDEVEGDTVDESTVADTSEMNESKPKEAEVEPDEERMSEITAWIEEVESHLTREHMKRVLGEVYMHTLITENTCIPTKGICDFLSNDPTNEDRAAKVLIGHIMKKMNKQTFPEYCSLCKEVLPFTDRKQAVCSSGHIWLRCVRSYQVCQSVTYRRCLLQDSIASVPQPEDPDWVKKILQGPCTFCDSPLL
ncbi:general transcription factor 3C polypeptide 4 isoform X1 [Ictalurus furcatus]|uniref:general transcription factor 3C polypeptide 4 isoform X1 n=1 Tax=Ictalurus furcatus TaxID=66913 RepID=UPI0023505B3A|nr:general transcription factor 3C polypeptide 4 isoform X1 [Ictalurus furcatus]